jgi:NADPH:quinone reductase-like Zn-dependent oxidoreductase
VKFPAHLSWAEAACLPCAGVTAFSALGFNEGSIAGKTVLVQGIEVVLSP